MAYQRLQIGQGIEQHVRLQLALQQPELALGRLPLQCFGTAVYFPQLFTA